MGDQEKIEAGGYFTFTNSGVRYDPPGSRDDVLDMVAAIRDEYAKKRTEALDQMEMFAAQGDTKEVSFHSSEAEKYGYALLASNRILTILEKANV